MPVRAALFSYFELDDLTRLMNAIAGSGMPAGVRVHVGEVLGVLSTLIPRSTVRPDITILEGSHVAA